MSANTYGRQVVIPLTNKSGGGVIAGDVVIIDTSNNDAFTTTTSAAATKVIGVVQETIASNAVGRVLTEGYAALVNTSASVTRGDYGTTHTVAKQAVDAGASRIAGTFCQFLTGGTTPDALVFPSDLGAGSGLTGGTPGVTLSTTNSAGVAATGIRTDATIAVFDATVPAAIGTAAAGSAGTAARRDHVHPLNVWTTYSPSWTSDGSAPTLNNGTLTGRYKQLDSKTYAIQINFVFGSGSAAGTGNYSFSLPAGLTSGALVQVLAGVVLDSGTRYYLGAGYVAAGGTTVTWIVNSESGGAGRTGQTTPMTFATGDEVNLSGIIEVA